jgi:hypothetical protein
MTTTTAPSNLDRLQNRHSRHIGDYALEQMFGRTIVFEPSGAARMAAIIGWLDGIAMYDRPRAESLADDLMKVMQYLSGYGGRPETPSIPVPFKVKFHDDGCLNSFAIAWFRAVSNDDLHEYARTKGIEYAEAKKLLQIDDNLQEWRYVHHADGDWTESKLWHYAYSFNGGLIYHYPKDDYTNGSWSTHT